MWPSRNSPRKRPRQWLRSWHQTASSSLWKWLWLSLPVTCTWMQFFTEIEVGALWPLRRSIRCGVSSCPEQMKKKGVGPMRAKVGSSSEVQHGRGGHTWACVCMCAHACALWLLAPWPPGWLRGRCYALPSQLWWVQDLQRTPEIPQSLKEKGDNEVLTYIGHYMYLIHRKPTEQRDWSPPMDFEDRAPWDRNSGLTGCLPWVLALLPPFISLWLSASHPTCKGFNLPSGKEKQFGVGGTFDHSYSLSSSVRIELNSICDYFF